MRIGAFFDLDGTLLPAPSLERRFARYLLSRGELGPASLARWLARFGRTAWREWRAAVDSNKTYLTGARVSSLEGFLSLIAHLRFHGGALAQMEWHAARGHRLFLVTGTLRPVAELAAREIAAALAQRGSVPPGGEFTIAASEPAVRELRFTGELIGEAVAGTGKLRAMERLAAGASVALAESYAYGDAWSDRWMLARVGHPAAVNADWRLAWLARRHGWALLDWREDKKPQGLRVTRKVERVSAVHL